MLYIKSQFFITLDLTCLFLLLDLLRILNLFAYQQNPLRFAFDLFFLALYTFYPDRGIIISWNNRSLILFIAPQCLSHISMFLSWGGMSSTVAQTSLKFAPTSRVLGSQIWIVSLNSNFYILSSPLCAEYMGTFSTWKRKQHVLEPFFVKNSYQILFYIVNITC